MKIEINPNRISDGDEAWEAGWEAACEYRNGNLERAVDALRQLADFTESFCDEVRVSKHYPSIEKARNLLREIDSTTESTPRKAGE